MNEPMRLRWVVLTGAALILIVVLWFAATINDVDGRNAHAKIKPNAGPGWAEEFTSGMGSMTGLDITFGTLHVTPAQCVVSGGNLNLNARYIGEGNWQSCMARTSLTFDHGYFETRMTYPFGDYDAAFWLRRPDSYAAPRDEIDIIEAYPTDYPGCPGPNKYQATMHYVQNGLLPFKQVTHDAGHSLVGAWHTYAADWLPGNRITFYMDGVALPETGNPITTNVIAASPFNVVLSLGVGTWCEPQPNTPTETPSLGTMLVDYARWWNVKP